jgi:hypothetical protein
VTRLYSEWLRSCGLITGRVRDLSLLQNTKAVVEAHPASYSISIRGLSSWVQMVRLKTYHLPPSSTKVKNARLQYRAMSRYKRKHVYSTYSKYTKI